jgi:hypothetical protein
MLLITDPQAGLTINTTIGKFLGLSFLHNYSETVEKP